MSQPRNAGMCYFTVFDNWRPCTFSKGKLETLARETACVTIGHKMGVEKIFEIILFYPL